MVGERAWRWGGDLESVRQKNYERKTDSVREWEGKRKTLNA